MWEVHHPVWEIRQGRATWRRFSAAAGSSRSTPDLLFAVTARLLAVSIVFTDGRHDEGPSFAAVQRMRRRHREDVPEHRVLVWREGRRPMLYTIAVILLVLWLLGLVSG